MHIIDIVELEGGRTRETQALAPVRWKTNQDSAQGIPPGRFLQQLYAIRVLGADRRVMNTSYEWREVPTVEASESDWIAGMDLSRS